MPLVKLNNYITIVFKNKYLREIGETAYFMWLSPHKYDIMPHMIDRLEKKIGKYAVKNLIYYILGAYVIGYVLYMAKPEWYMYIVLDPSLVMKGQLWRLFTWVCSVPQALSILLIFMFLFYFYIGRTLEKYLGAFKYNLYIFSGWFFTTLGVMLSYWLSGGSLVVSASTYYINLTSFLAFAVLFPDAKVLLFAVIPIKMKILAWIDGIYLGLQVISGLIIALSPVSVVGQALQLYTGIPASVTDVAIMRQSSFSLIITILISVLNFLIFFFVVNRKKYRQEQRKKEFSKKMESTARTQSTQGAFGAFRQNAEGELKSTEKSYRANNAGALVHRCTVCGRTSVDHPELMFRYCSRCEGSHEYCQDHLFTHEHIKK